MHCSENSGATAEEDDDDKACWRAKARSAEGAEEADEEEEGEGVGFVSTFVL